MKLPAPECFPKDWCWVCTVPDIFDIRNSGKFASGTTFFCVPMLMRVFPTFSLFKSMRKIQNEPFICAGSRANSPRQSIGLDHGYLTNEGKPQVSISDFFCSCHPPKSVKRNSWNVKKLLPRPRRNLQQNFARISIKSVKGRRSNMALGSGRIKSIKKRGGKLLRIAAQSDPGKEVFAQRTPK